MTQRMVCAAVLALALASPAAAEPATRLAQARSDVLPPHEILTILRSTALSPIGRPVRRGDTYVLRAIDEDYGDELRVVVDARNGEILSMTPADGGARTAAPGAGIGPAGPMPPGAYRSGPPSIIYEEGPPPGYGRPPGAIAPPPPGRYSSAPPTGPSAAPPTIPPSVSGATGSTPPSEPQDFAAPGNDAGPLPAPPERFPQRAAPPPAAKPAPPPRRAAAAPTSSTPPSSTPLPKPRPGGSVTQVAPPQADAAPLPPPIPLSPPGQDVPH